MRWKGHVARMEEMRDAYKGAEEGAVLKYMFERNEGKVWTGIHMSQLTATVKHETRL